MAESISPERAQASATSLFVKDLVAGGVSGIIAKTIGAPIDRVKLLLQTQKINTSLAVQYRNPIDCIIRIHRSEGILSFWRGNLANVYRYFPSQAMNFAFKGRYSDFFTGLAKGGPELSATDRKYRRMMVSLLSGGLAGGTALLVSYPFDVARTRLAVDIKTPTVTVPAPALPQHSTSVSAASATHSGARSMSTQALHPAHSHSGAAVSGTGAGAGAGAGGGQRVYGGTFDCLWSTYRLEGMRGVYAGFGVSLAGVIVFRALYLGGYDIVKDHYELEHAPRMTRFIAAQAVTTVVGTLCFPIDTVKRRLMVQRKPTFPSAVGSPVAGTAVAARAAAGVKPTAAATVSTTTSEVRVPYKSGWDCARRIIAEEGVRGLFAGLSVNLVRGFSGAVLLVAYDDLKRYL